MALPPVPIGPMGADAWEQVAPLGRLDEQNGNVLAHLVAVLNAPIEDVASWALDGPDDEPGYAVLLTLDEAPDIALAWLGQFKGVRVTTGLPAEQQREEIQTAGGLRRGTVDSMVLAGQRHLAGERVVRVLDRVGGDMYAITVITRTSETPDPAATLADLMSAKRIGVILSHVITDEVLWAEATVTWDDVDPSVTWEDVALIDVT